MLTLINYNIQVKFNFVHSQVPESSMLIIIIYIIDVLISA